MFDHRTLKLIIEQNSFHSVELKSKVIKNK